MGSSAALKNKSLGRRVAVFDFGDIDYRAESQQLSGSFEMAGMPSAEDFRKRMVVHDKSVLRSSQKRK